jgi:RHS repeat-associated protein
VSYLYDYLGRLVERSAAARSSGSWAPLPRERRFFLYDGENMIQELDGTGATVASLVWGPENTGMPGTREGGGVPLAVVRGSLQLICLPDGGGTISQLVNAADGGLVEHHEYDPYGNDLAAGGTGGAAIPIRSSGEFVDAEAGLVIYRGRAYSPVLGRFLSRASDEAGGENPYAFMANDPIGRAHP